MIESEAAYPAGRAVVRTGGLPAPLAIVFEAHIQRAVGAAFVRLCKMPRVGYKIGRNAVGFTSEAEVEVKSENGWEQEAQGKDINC